MDNHNLPLPSAFQIRFNTDDQDDWPQEATLLAAAYSGHIHRLKEVATRLDADGKGIAYTLRHTSFEGMNVLHAAAAGKGVLPMCRYLVEEVRMDVNKRDTATGKNMTPLQHAVCAGIGNLPVLRYLLDNGADLHGASLLKGIQVVIVPSKDSCEQAEEARKEEVYHALSAQRTRIWHLYFYSIAFFSVILVFRPPQDQDMLRMTLEMFIAFTVMTLIHYGLVLHNSMWLTPLWASGLYQWAGAMGMWFFTACWMIMYTMTIPPAVYESRQLGITFTFVVLTLTITLLSKVARCGFLFGQEW